MEAMSLGVLNRNGGKEVVVFGDESERCWKLDRLHRHTVLEQDKRSECALPAELPPFSSIQISAASERAPSEAGSDGGGDESDHGRYRRQQQEEVAESDEDDEMPMEPDVDDDDHASDMRKMINSYDTYELLHLVGLGELVRFPITG
jgi:hypothetical protein